MKFLIGMLVLLSCSVFAADVSEFNYDGTSTQKEPSKAKKEILKAAAKNISYKLISELIGAEKFALQKRTVDSKILKNSNKYILYVKGGNLKSAEDGHAMTVTMKLSVKSLETMLLKEGLLFRAEGEGRVLPLVSFLNQTSDQSFRWWVDSSNKSQMASFSKDFNSELRYKFFDKGFYSFKPESFGFFEGLDEAYKKASLDSSQQLQLARSLGANMIIRGDIRWIRSGSSNNQYRIKAKLQVLHVSNGRIIAEVVRNYKTASGPAMQVLPAKFEEVKSALAKSLVSQVYESWEKGSLGTQLVKLVLSGDLSFAQVNSLRKAIRSKIKGVRSVKHRGYQAGKVSLEMDSSASSRQIADAIKKHSFKPHTLSVTSVTGTEIRVNVKSL